MSNQTNIKRLSKPIEVKTEDNEEIGNNEILKDTSRYVKMIPRVWKLSYMDTSEKRIDEYYEQKMYANRRYEQLKAILTDDQS